MHSTTVLALFALIVCCVFSCSSADVDQSAAIVPEDHAAGIDADSVLERQKRAYGYGGRKKRGYGYRKKRDMQTEMAVGDPADAEMEGDLQLRQKRGYGRGKRDILSVAPVGDMAVSSDGDIKLRQKRGYGYRKKRSYGYGRKKRGYGY